MFFIVGTGRCGTKLLRQMLINHPKVKIIIESHFLPMLYEKFGTENVSFRKFYDVIENHFDSTGNSWLLTIQKKENLRIDNFQQNFEKYCESINHKTIKDYYEAFASFLYGKGYYLGDKTPHYGTNMLMIKKIWKNAKFIHLTRDGIHTSISMTKHRGFIKLINSKLSVEFLDRCHYNAQIQTFSEEKVTLDKAVKFWQKIVKKIIIDSKKIPKNDYLEIKFENLINDTSKTLNKIGSFLELPEDNDWIKRSVLLPRAFYLFNQKSIINNAEYDYYSSIIKEEQQYFGYPLDKKYYKINKLDFYRKIFQ